MPNNKKIRELKPEEEKRLLDLIRESTAFKADLLRGMCLTAWNYRENVQALEIISIYGAGFNAMHAAKAVEWYPKYFDDTKLPDLHVTYEDYLCLIAIADLPKDKADKLFIQFEKERKRGGNPWKIYVEAQVLKGKRERHDPAALKFDGRVTFRKRQVLIKPTTATGVVVRDNGDYHVKLIRKEKDK